MFIFLIILTYVYAGLPEHVVIYNNGGAMHQILKNHLFYSALAIFFAANVLISATTFYLKRKFSENRALESTANWLQGFAGFLNLFFSGSVLSIWAINTNSSELMVKTFFYSALILVIVLLFSLIHLINKAVRS